MSNSLPLQDQFVKRLSNPQTSSPNGTHIHSMNNPPTIRDVWEDNFEEEFSIIMDLAEKYRVIGMDTEFPGVVYRLNETDLGSLYSGNDLEYKTIKINTDKLKVIQVGFSFSNEEGYVPENVTTWQFNFKFNLDKDEYLPDAIELLTDSGIRFEEHAKRGIKPQQFAEYLIASGLLFNEDIKWITFHGGFDFAYLIRMLHGQNLPDDETGFYDLLNIYFPTFYDVKHMARELDNFKSGGLQKLASDLNVRRIGPQHQAGSDAMLTIATYLKLKGTYLKNSPDHRHVNVLYGIGSNGEEVFNEYVWQNYVAPADYSQMMYNGYPMNNVGMMDQYYPQSDSMYGSHFNMPYNTPYNNYGHTGYMEGNLKFKKFEMYTGKAKN